MEHQKDVSVPFKFQFFKGVRRHLNSFLITFQTDSPLVPFLVESLESMVQKFYSTFILSDKMEKTESTIKLVKPDVTDKNIH